MTGKSDSFAHYTMTNRLPAILQTVLNDYEGLYPPPIVEAVQDLRRSLLENRPIPGPPDNAGWTAAWQSYQDRHWLDLPWFFAETYLYRLLIEAVGYFGRLDPHWFGIDPFLPRKQAEWQSETPWQTLAAVVDQPDSPDGLRRLLTHALWGNQVDLSYQKSVEMADDDSSQGNLVADASEEVAVYLYKSRSDRLEIICDNAGTELLLDLALVDFLLRYDRVGCITMHVKSYPTFVSDATPADVITALSGIQGPLADRLTAYRRQRRLCIRPDRFWNSSRFYWELPPTLKTELSEARLVISKGDLNYRRLFADRAWPPTTPLAEAILSFPAPVALLRTLKSDVIVGLAAEQVAILDAADPEWRTNGRRGVIQAVLAAQ